MKALVEVCLIILMAVSFVMPAFAQDLMEGLVAYWQFNDGSGNIASDSSGNGYDGTLNGDPEWVDGHFGDALEFDGNGDEVNVPYNDALNPKKAFTVCLWANVASGSSGHRAPISSRDDNPLAGYIIYAEPGNTWQYWIGTGAWNILQGPAVEFGEWTHLTAIYSDGTQKIYVNGELAGETVGLLEVNAANNLLIGAGANERPAHEYLFVGGIDDVILYNRVLTEEEIAKVMSGEIAFAVSASNKIAATWGMIKR
jgi:hypothetical protein